ncbi:MAG TPA: heme-binding protein [Woeseiaceae bacterium]|nr:heme-binding protein [Woeseiaceae bacterium]
MKVRSSIRTLHQSATLSLCGLATGLLLGACGGGTVSVDPGTDSTVPDTGCNGHCADNPEALTMGDVGAVITQAVAEAGARSSAATIAVVDRSGNVLAVFRMNAAATSITIASPGAPRDGGLEGVNIVPDTLAAISKAVTAAYLSTEGNAFTTRTASQIVQEHFSPGDHLQPSGPLFGVQFSQLPCSDLLTRFSGSVSVGPHRSPLGLSADPGAFPLYKSGTPVGAIGVISDALYSFDDDINDIDADSDEVIALAGAYGFAAPEARRANRIALDGRSLRFSDAKSSDLMADPGAAPTFASIDSVLGTLQSVPGYVNASISGGTAFGQAASGIRPDTLDFPGADAFVLVDGANLERFRPRPGTDGPGALTRADVTAILSQALAIANRARGQIRQPVESPARVSISVVDTNGVILGIVRSRDAPVFGIDVAVQKARTAAFYSSAAAAAALNALPPATYLDGGLVVLRKEPLSQYVTAARDFLGLPGALADGAIAFSDRAGGNLSRPWFPDGVDGSVPGPFSKPAGKWSPFATGLQLDLSYNAIVQHVGFVLAQAADVPMNCTGIDGFDTGFVQSGVISQLANGMQIFPGSVPIYRGAQLVGAIGVSGDGVDQDDMIAFLAVDAAAAEIGGFNNAEPAMRADTLVPQGTRLRYVNCPIAPFLDSDEQRVCDGK